LVSLIRGWRCDIEAWARSVASVLAIGGRLVLLGFHPLVRRLDGDGRLVEPFFPDGPLEETGVTDYAGEGLVPSGAAAGIEARANPELSFGLHRPAAQIVQAVLDAGLRLDTLRE
jgi:hypothetical protein